MTDCIKHFFIKLNSLGIPVPLIKDPKTRVGSVSLTLVFLSSIYVQIGLIGKFTKLLDGVDINMAINWFVACSALYFGRNLSTKSVTADQNDTKEGK